LSQQTKYINIDGQYCFAPEHSFPAALHYTEDAVNWVLDQPTIFDTSRVSISEFSASGNLAFVAFSCIFAPDTFSSVLAFYPVVEAFADPGSLVTVNPCCRSVYGSSQSVIGPQVLIPGIPVFRLLMLLLTGTRVGFYCHGCL
jgi:hypothetical protein